MRTHTRSGTTPLFLRLAFAALLLTITAAPQALAQAVRQDAAISAVERQLTEVEQKLDAALEQYQGPAEKRLPLGLHLLAILVGGILVLALLKLAKARMDKLLTKKDAIRESDRRLRAKTVTQLLYWLGAVCVFLSMLTMALAALGINLAPMIAGIGVLSLALGFGAQSLVRDIINGIFILLEDQYHVNDVVRIGSLAGLVEEVNLRVTVLRNLEGQVIYIPNGEIKTVINLTKGWSRAVLDIGVAYKENVDRVMEVMRAVGAELRQDPEFGKLMLEDIEIPGVDGFGDSQVTIRCMIKTVPIKQWQVAREFRRRLKNRFDALGIEIPFPHRTLYWGSGQIEAMQKAAEARKETEE